MSIVYYVYSHATHSPLFCAPLFCSPLLCSPLLPLHYSKRSSTGRISYTPSSSSSPCGICIDWLENDTLVVAASIPVRAPPSHDPTVRTSRAKHVPPPPPTPQSGSGSGTRRAYDFAFTALTVGDIFTGGYSAPTSEPGPRPQTGERESERDSRGSSPGVGVLRGVASDLTGLRTFPNTTSSTTSATTSSSASCEGAASVVVCAGALMIALSFPAVRVVHGTVDPGFHRPLTVTELQAVYMDVRTVRTDC
jgi:hypothetical protein